MRPQMELDGGSVFFIHCIFGKLGDGLINYMRIAPEQIDGSVVTLEFKEGDDGKYLAMGAVWAGLG